VSAPPGRAGHARGPPVSGASPGSRRVSLRPGADDARLVEDAPSMSLQAVFVKFCPTPQPLRWWILLGMGLLAVSSLIAIADPDLPDSGQRRLAPANFAPLLRIALAYLGLNLLSAVVSGATSRRPGYRSGSWSGLCTDPFRHADSSAGWVMCCRC
jgi:ATP-binding cassette, subfamily B, bacterial